MGRKGLSQNDTINSEGVVGGYPSPPPLTYGRSRARRWPFNHSRGFVLGPPAKKLFGVGGVRSMGSVPGDNNDAPMNGSRK